MTQFLGNFQLVATLPPPETLQSSIKPEKPEKRPLPSLGVGKEAKREKARGSPLSFPPAPSSGGRRAAVRPEGAAVRSEQQPHRRRPHLPRPGWPSPAKFQQPPVERAPGTSTARAEAHGADQPD